MRYCNQRLVIFTINKIIIYISQIQTESEVLPHEPKYP